MSEGYSDIVLEEYKAMRDNGGVGLEKGLPVDEIAKNHNWKKIRAQGALQTAKKEGRKLDRPLYILCAVRTDIVKENGGKKIVKRPVHYIPANAKEARRDRDRRSSSLLGQAEIASEILNGLGKEFPKLEYTPVQHITKRVQLMIPFPIEEKE